MRRTKKKQKRRRLPPHPQAVERGERQLAPATKLDHALRARHVTKTLTIGCIAANVKRALAGSIVPASAITSTSTPLTSTSAPPIPDHEAITTRLNSCVKALNQMRTHAYEIVALDISRILGDRYKPSVQTAVPPSPLSARDLSDLSDILDNLGFYHSLCTLLCQGKIGPNSRAARLREAPPPTIMTRSRATASSTSSTSTSQPAPEVETESHAERAYQEYRKHTSIEPFTKQFQGNMFPSTVARLALSAVKHAVRAHYLGSKVCRFNKTHIVLCHLSLTLRIRA